MTKNNNPYKHCKECEYPISIDSVSDLCPLCDNKK